MTAHWIASNLVKIYPLVTATETRPKKNHVQYENNIGANVYYLLPSTFEYLPAVQ